MASAIERMGRVRDCKTYREGLVVRGLVVADVDLVFQAFSLPFFVKSEVFLSGRYKERWVGKGHRKKHGEMEKARCGDGDKEGSCDFGFWGNLVVSM